MLLNKTYSLGTTSLLTKSFLKFYIEKFFKDIFEKIAIKNKKFHLLLMVKVQFVDESLGYRTLADLRKVNFSGAKGEIKIYLFRI